MLAGVYSAASGMDAAATQHEVIARNLAHAAQPGFRRSLVVYPTFESTLSTAGVSPTGREAWGVGAPRVVTDFTSGVVQHTGRTLDCAIDGDGYFVLDGPSGPLYTRDGVFQVDGQGRLVTSDGLTVQGEGGPITIPPDLSVGEIAIATDGTFSGLISGAVTTFGKLKVVTFDDPTLLTPQGGVLFSAAGASPQSGDAKIVQGSRELSNVSAVEELVRMIAALRHYEASQRAMRTIAESVQQNTAPR
jgi:flagellar basal body rod protein FlgG